MSAGLYIFEKQNVDTAQDVLDFLKQDLVVCMFSAPWCAPCHRLSPIVQKVASENDRVKFCKVNIEDFPELADQYNVTVVPTLIFFYKNSGVYTMVGASEAKLRAGIEILQKMDEGNVQV